MLPPDVITGGTAWKDVIEQAFTPIDGRGREQQTEELFYLNGTFLASRIWKPLTLCIKQDFDEFKKMYHFCVVQQKTETEFLPRAAFPSEIIPDALYLGKSSFRWGAN